MNAWLRMVVTNTGEFGKLVVVDLQVRVSMYHCAGSITSKER
jgi:hypothetical protein